jgi:hypothetical protein
MASGYHFLMSAILQSRIAQACSTASAGSFFRLAFSPPDLERHLHDLVVRI